MMKNVFYEINSLPKVQVERNCVPGLERVCEIDGEKFPIHIIAKSFDNLKPKTFLNAEGCQAKKFIPEFLNR